MTQSVLVISAPKAKANNCFASHKEYIVNQWFIQLRNECLFFLVHGEWIVARDKQIVVLVGLFVPRYDSFPMNQEKKALIPNIYNVSNKDSF